MYIYIYIQLKPPTAYIISARIRSQNVVHYFFSQAARRSSPQYILSAFSAWRVWSAQSRFEIASRSQLEFSSSSSLHIHSLYFGFFFSAPRRFLALASLALCARLCSAPDISPHPPSLSGLKVPCAPKWLDSRISNAKKRRNSWSKLAQVPEQSEVTRSG